MNNKIVVILLLLITAGIAFAAEDWNLGTVQTFWNVDIKGGNISANGSGLTNINVSNATGTLANERLPANIMGKMNLTSKNIGGVIYADQYATIQDAINASNSTTYHPEIYIPAGRYGITQPITVPSNTIIKGAGRGATIIYAINSSYWYDSATYNRAMIENLNHFDGGTGSGDKNIHILSLTLDGNVSNINPTKVLNKNPLNGIKLGWVTTSTVNDVEVHDVASFGIGIWGNNVAPKREPKSIISNNYLWNISYNEDPTDGRFSTAIFSSNNINSGVIITGNIIHDVSTGIELEDGALEDIISNNYIVDCVGNNGSGIKSTNGGYDTIISNNIVKKCYTGINWYDGSRSIISSNIIKNNRNYGIVVGGNGGNPLITSNQIKDNNASGIYVKSGTTLFTISNNNLDNNGQNSSKSVPDRAAIQLDSSEGKVIGNSIFDLDGSFQTSWAVNASINSGPLLIAFNRVIPSHFLNGTFNLPSGMSAHDNPGTSPYNFGNSATAPTAVGAGDTYYNTTANRPCYRGASAWLTYADVSGC